MRCDQTSPSPSPFPSKRRYSALLQTMGMRSGETGKKRGQVQFSGTFNYKLDLSPFLSRASRFGSMPNNRRSTSSAARWVIRSPTTYYVVYDNCIRRDSREPIFVTCFINTNLPTELAKHWSCSTNVDSRNARSPRPVDGRSRLGSPLRRTLIATKATEVTLLSLWSHFHR